MSEAPMLPTETTSPSSEEVLDLHEEIRAREDEIFELDRDSRKAQEESDRFRGEYTRMMGQRDRIAHLITDIHLAVGAPDGMEVEALPDFVRGVKDKLDASGRRRLPNERKSVNHKVVIGGCDVYFIVGLYPEGVPGEVFITIAKEGSTLGGLLDNFATAVSICLQHGASLATLADKYVGQSYEPSGPTTNPDIPSCMSIPDYLFRWLQRRFPVDASKSIEKASVSVASAFLVK